MKLSFSLASKKPSTAAATTTVTSAFESSSAASDPLSTTKQFVTEFDPSKPASQTLIIPPKPNEYTPINNKKLKNLDIEPPTRPDSSPLQFELDSGGSNIEQGPNSIGYGLNVRKLNGGGVGSVGDSLLASYKEDMMRLPDDPGFEEFEDMPVEGFGAALLAGYGWKEGMGIGKNAREDVKIVEYKKWAGKEGLGFTKDGPEMVINGKKDGTKGVESDKGRGKKDGRIGEEVVGVESDEGRGRNDGRSGEEVIGVESDEGRREENGRMDVEMEDRGVDRREGSRRSSREKRDGTRENVASSRRSARNGRDEDAGNGEEVIRVEGDKGRGKRDGRNGEGVSIVESDNGRGRNNGRNGEEVTRVESDGGRGKKYGRNGKEFSRVESDRRRGKKDARSGEEVVRVESDNGRHEEKGKGRVDVGMEDRVVDRRSGSSSSRERRDDTRENAGSSRKSTRDGRDEDVRDSRKERRHRGGEDVEKKSKDGRKRGHEEMMKSESVIWVRSHIRVRVVSEAVKGGRLYLKKGEVVDVVGPSCDILMDESRELVQGVSQECLETALPKRGGPVLVLYGKHKGVYGSLVEKDTDKETGMVRDADNHETFNVRLEQIAEFIGDPSYIGY
ncbi:hypothetical protein Leryth_000520 [Lithospermum erythrorhizon]|nr:hypothetical protein Leryth_000520 [Lithospermum erythrorhizon]